MNRISDVVGRVCDRLLGRLDPQQEEVQAALVSVREARRHCQTLRERRAELMQKSAAAMRAEDAQEYLILSKKIAGLTARIALIERFLPKGRLPEIKKPAAIPAAKSTREQEAVQLFVFSSLLLYQAWRICTERAEEGLCLLRGVEHDDSLIATEIIRLRYSERSIVSANPESRSLQRSAIETSETGHNLVSLVHAHPGRGASATRPSGTDRLTQRNWESGWRFVSGIFSRDGFIRFFAERQRFEIHVLGNHTEQINEHVFRLDLQAFAS